MKIIRINVENIHTFNKLEYFPEKNINLIYGENGVGKSSFVEIFDLIIMIFNRQIISSEVLSTPNMGDSDSIDAIFDLYNNYSTIGNDDGIKIEFDFEHNEKNGSYVIEFDKNNCILFEKLEYALKKRKTTIYKRHSDCSIETKHNSLRNVAIKYELEQQNSLISFIELLKTRNLINNDSDEYKIIGELANIFICNHKFHKNDFHIERGGALNERFILEEDQLQSFKEKMEDDVLEQFKEFVYQIDEHVLDIKYDTSYSESTKKYYKTLVFTKELSNSTVDVPYNKESTGTRRYLEYFNYILMAKTTDNIFIWDEVGANLQQNLAVKVFEYMVKIMKKYNRQMIMTSHSVALLDCVILTNKEKQILINHSGVRSIRNLSGIDPKDKISKRYLEGYYGGIPSLSPIWEFNE